MTKITTVEQLIKLAKDTKVIKFPKEGDPVETYDETNDSDASISYVKENRADLEELEFAISGGMLGTISGTLHPAKQTYEYIIDSGKYWIE